MIKVDATLGATWPTMIRRLETLSLTLMNSRVLQKLMSSRAPCEGDRQPKPVTTRQET